MRGKLQLLSLYLLGRYLLTLRLMLEQANGGRVLLPNMWGEVHQSVLPGYTRESVLPVPMAKKQTFCPGLS